MKTILRNQMRAGLQHKQKQNKTEQSISSPNFALYTINEVYMAYLNQVNVGAIEIVKRGVLTRDISEH